MIQKTFDTTPEFLHDLLKSLQNGKTQLPDFQRGWVWDDDRIRGVLASISRSFPIGALMMLETGGEARLQPRPVQEVVFPGPGERPVPERLILDGQQRLTSLYQAIMLGDVVETVNARNQKIKRWYYIDVHKALNSAEDREDAFIGMPENKVSMFQGNFERDLSTPEREYETFCFPVNAVFDSARWRHAYSKFWQYAPAKMELFDEFEQEILMRFKQYQIPVITLKREVPKEAVCHVFEKVNTGGMVLNAFELLTATYAADNFNLRDDWYGNADRGVEGIHPRFAKKKVLHGVANTDFLQTVTLLHTLAKRETDQGNSRPEEATPVSCKRSALLNLPLDGYRRWRDAAAEGFLRASAFLHLEHIYLARDLPYQTQLVPLAAVLALLGDRWEDVGTKEKIRRWYWCGVLGELYGSAVESQFAKDLPELLNWIDGGPEPSTVRDAVFNPSRLHSLRTRNSAAYKGLYALLMREGGLDLRTGNPITYQTYEEEAIDIHHVFPKKWCDDLGIEPSRRDCIVNKTAISATTNRIIGGQAPSSYLERLQKKSEITDEQMRSILRSHLIEPEHLCGNNFEAFFATREAALLERIRSAMGKEVVEEGPGAEPVGDVVEPEELEDADLVEMKAA